MGFWARCKSCVCGSATGPGPHSANYDGWLARERLRQLDAAERKRETLQRENYALEMQLGQAMNILESYQSFTGDLDAMHRASSGLPDAASDPMVAFGPGSPTPPLQVEQGGHGSFSFTGGQVPSWAPRPQPPTDRESASPRRQPLPIAAPPAQDGAPVPAGETFATPVQPVVSAPTSPPVAPAAPKAEPMPSPTSPALSPPATSAAPAASTPATAAPPAPERAPRAILDLSESTPFFAASQVPQGHSQPVAQGTPYAYHHGYQPRAQGRRGPGMVDPPPSRKMPARVAQMHKELRGTQAIHPPAPRVATPLSRYSPGGQSLADKVRRLTPERRGDSV